MKAKHFVITLPLLMIIIGCSDNYHVMLRNWVGIGEDHLVGSWGTPVKTYTSGNSKFFVYHEDGGSPTGCTTTFETIHGVVDSFEYVGEGCVGDFYTHTTNKL